MSDLSPLAQTAVIGTSTRPFSPGTLPSAVTSALPPHRRGTEGAGDAKDTSEGTEALLDAAAAYGAVHRATIPAIPSSAASDTGWAASSRPPGT